jgi:hypothetical protein
MFFRHLLEDFSCRFNPGLALVWFMPYYLGHAPVFQNIKRAGSAGIKRLGMDCVEGQLD